MPHEIEFENMPVGYAETCALDADESVLVRGIGVATSADGELLSIWLSGYPTEILEKVGKVGAKIRPSSVDTLLAIIRPDKTATVYVNEIKFAVRIRVTPERIADRIEAGQAIYDEDIEDILIARIEGIEIPADCGVVLVLSDGWRRAILFDLLPLSPKEFGARNYDLSRVMGEVFSTFRFQHVFGLTESDWSVFFDGRWFPFSGLTKETLKLMVSAVRCGRNPDELLGRVHQELLGRLNAFVDVWRKSTSFEAHLPLLEHAIVRYKENDFVSCTSIAIPRIEGLLRANHTVLGAKGSLSQANLCSSAVAGILDRNGSMLLPSRFKQYLEKVYFASFDPNSPIIDVGRNSVSHGVASPAHFDLKSATLSLLVCHQLYSTFLAASDLGE